MCLRVGRIQTSHTTKRAWAAWAFLEWWSSWRLWTQKCPKIIFIYFHDFLVWLCDYDSWTQSWDFETNYTDDVQKNRGNAATPLYGINASHTPGFKLRLNFGKLTGFLAAPPQRGLPGIEPKPASWNPWKLVVASDEFPKWGNLNPPIFMGVEKLAGFVEKG